MLDLPPSGARALDRDGSSAERRIRERGWLPWLLLVALAVSGCSITFPGTHLPTPDPWLSATLVERIAQAGAGKDWYRAIKLVDGKPVADVMGSGGTGPTGTALAGLADVYLAAGVGGTSTLATLVCRAVLAAANDGTLGPPLNLPHVWVYGSELGTECFAPIP